MGRQDMNQVNGIKDGMTFHSILSNQKQTGPFDTRPPDFLSDLNLDLLIDTITKAETPNPLKPFFYTPLQDIDLILYRQEVMRDLEDETLLQGIKTFAAGMNQVERYLTMTEKMIYDAHRKGWLLEAVLIYCETLSAQVRALSNLPLKSRGLRSFREYVSGYVASPAFHTLFEEARRVKQVLSEITYCVTIQSGKFRVKRYEGEPDYSVEVERIFEKFKQETTQAHLVRLPPPSGMTHIEAKILELVTRLYPEAFALLDQFHARHIHFMDPIIQSFGREIRFYIAYLDFIADFKKEGLPFCYPTLTPDSKEIYAKDGFDLSLAHVLRERDESVVTNDIFLKDPERILVVTGPNQGGKTTYARMFGQLHFLASLGCPVPAREARLFLFDRILTHFEREEDIRNLRGKFEDDLVRMREIMDRATSRSILVVNEIFASTSLQDAFLLSREIMTRLMELDVLCVWVTFIDELATLGEKTVSMVAAVDPQDPTRRTYKVVRKPADGLAHALSLARRYRLTYPDIKERLS